MSPARATLRAAVVGAGATWAARTALLARPPGGLGRWARANHRGRAVDLLAGPAAVAGLLAAGASTGGQRGLAIAVAAFGAGAAGTYDDLRGDRRGVSSDVTTQLAAKGFRGHLGALRAGQLTTGVVKVVAVGSSALVASVLVERRGEAALRTAALVAAGANLANLLDLRPGRAGKVVLLVAVPLAARGGAGAPPAAGVAATAAVLLPADLAERTMLGDAGANALGAAVTLAAALGLAPPAETGVLAALVALTAASEVLSFSQVIDATPGLRTLDRLGRRR